MALFDAMPGSKWDLPVSFLNYRSALLHAIELAETFAAMTNGPRSISILTPDCGPYHWTINGLLFTRHFAGQRRAA
jgi:hypothetical protein